MLRAANVSFPASLPAIVDALPSDRHDILCLPIIDWRFRFQRPQHIMRQFASRGHRVFYLSQEFLLATRAAVALLERNVFDLKLPADAANAFQGVLEGDDVRGMADGVASLRAAGMIRNAMIVVQHPFWLTLAEELRERFGWPIVYDCMDDHAGLRRQGGCSPDVETRLVQTADLTVVTSDRLLDKVASQSRRAALVRNGVDYEHFAAAEPAPPAGENVVVGYYGAIAHWFDARLVADLAKLRPDWRFELVGNTFSSDLRALHRLSNVSLLGEMPYAAIPGRLAQWHCCIIPFLRNELTEATNPLKVYEMLAAGMPAVAVDLPELRPIAAANLIDSGSGITDVGTNDINGTSPAANAFF